MLTICGVIGETARSCRGRSRAEKIACASREFTARLISSAVGAVLFDPLDLGIDLFFDIIERFARACDRDDLVETADLAGAVACKDLLGERILSKNQIALQTRTAAARQNARQDIQSRFIRRILPDAFPDQIDTRQVCKRVFVLFADDARKLRLRHIGTVDRRSAL